MFILLTQILCCQMRNWRISLLSKGYDFAYFFVFLFFCCQMRNWRISLLRATTMLISSAYGKRVSSKS